MIQNWFLIIIIIFYFIFSNSNVVLDAHSGVAAAHINYIYIHTFRIYCIAIYF